MVGSTVHQAASAGAHARVRNVAVRLRNQQQQTAIYITSGAPSISDCDIQGTVLVAGPRCAPTISRCVIRGSRGFGLRCTDHSLGVYTDLEIRDCKHSAVGISSGAAPCLRALRCRGNWRCCTVAGRPGASVGTLLGGGAVRPLGAVCDADVCRRAASGGGEDSDGEEGEDVDRYGLPTHWYQPPFSTAVHGFAGNADSDDTSVTSAGGAAVQLT